MRIDPMYIFEALLALISIAERFFRGRNQGEQKKNFVLGSLENGVKLSGDTIDMKAAANMVDTAVAMVFPKEKPKSKARDFSKSLDNP